MEYISKDKTLKKLQMQLLDLEAGQDKGEYSELCENRGARGALDEAINDIRKIKGEDVQPLSVVAEHIKKRLYETAFNTTKEKARNAIVDMAGRIDFWIDELKEGESYKEEGKNIICQRTVIQMADELIRLDTTIIGIDSLINKASTVEEAKVLFTVKDTIYTQQRYVIMDGDSK